MSKTLQFYEENAERFAETTQNIAFSEIQSRFLSLLSPGACILDLGCGAGRDCKAFCEAGFCVDAVDGCASLCQIASAYSGVNVSCERFEDWKPRRRYDGIWACASLLHLPRTEQPAMFDRIQNGLLSGGICYSSFKYGEYEGFRNGRFFTDMTESLFSNLLALCPDFELICYDVTRDVRPERQDEQWLNILLRKK